MTRNCYLVQFTPAGHEPIQVYHETDCETAIKRALGIFHNFPIPHKVVVIDSFNQTICLLNKTSKNI